MVEVLMACLVALEKRPCMLGRSCPGLGEEERSGLPLADRKFVPAIRWNAAD